MKIYMTICSKKKREHPPLLPSVDRYISDRINRIYNKSRDDNVDFRILSGRYGLVGPMDYIINYDKLLTSEGVDELIEKVSSQLKSYSVDDVVFYGRDFKKFPELEPYYAVIEKASTKSNVNLNYKLIK